MATCYVIYLWGDDVFGNVSMQKVITDNTKIDDVVSDIATKYNMEFVLYNNNSLTHQYRNITDDRDISIIVEHMELE